MEACGQVSKQDKSEEEIYLNPNKIEEIQRRQEEKRLKDRVELLNEDKIKNEERKRFEEVVYSVGESTVVVKPVRKTHPEIPPAKARIQDFKRKDLTDLYHKQVAELKGNRPHTSKVPATHTLGGGISQAEMTTQAQSSVFEETEGAYNELPFNKFYSTNDPVVFKSQNRFEGRSNYHYYYPSSDINE